MATSTVENYVKEIYHLQEQSGDDRLVPMGQVALALNVVPGTATTMVKNLEKAGLVRYESRVGVQLTEEGSRLALSVLRRHRLIEVFLVQVLGFDWSEIHDDAEMLEHAISDRVLEGIDRLCGHPKFDPHGDPIPSAKGTIQSRPSEPLTACALQAPLVVARISDQESEFLHFAEERGLVPNAQLQVTERSIAAEAVTVRFDNGNELTLGNNAAEKIWVAEGE